MFKRILYTLVFTAALIFSFVLTVQAKSDEPEPDGILAGLFILHPGASLSLGYDSLGGTSFGSKDGDGFLEVGGHFKTRLDDEEFHRWNNELSFKWRQYWGVAKAKTVGGPDIRVASSADIFKKRFLMISPRISYNYRDKPEDSNYRQDFKNHTINAGSAFTIQPGGGAIFAQRLAYHLNARIYPATKMFSNDALYPGLEHLFYDDHSFFDHRFESVTKWNFLPHSSMSLNLDFRVIHFLKGASSKEDLVQNEGMSLPVRATYSLQGLLTERLSYLAALGYSYVYSSQGLKEHMSIAKVQLRYAFTNRLALAVKYRKDHEQSTYGQYYKLHLTSLDFDAFWFDHLQTDFSIGFGVFDFKGSEIDSRRDYLITGDAAIFYHFWAGMKLGLAYQLRFNNSEYRRQLNIYDQGEGSKTANYTHHFLHLKFSYEY